MLTSVIIGKFSLLICTFVCARDRQRKTEKGSGGKERIWNVMKKEKKREGFQKQYSEAKLGKPEACGTHCKKYSRHEILEILHLWDSIL